jgi:Tfp pilus assembly protein PilX
MKLSTSSPEGADRSPALHIERLKDERGVALILAMLMLAVLSIIAASLMSVAEVETAGSTNYRQMTLARYGGESAVHMASNYLMGASYTAVAPGTASDPLTNYVTTGATVTYGGSPVVLSTVSGESNYPVTSVVTGFTAAATGSLAGSSPVTYQAVARLVSMRQITTYSGVNATVQTWQITGRGVLPGARPAAVEVSSVLERQVGPTFSYAAFATSAGCAALDWQGHSKTDSYDSVVSVIPDSPPYGGNVGTNGNLTLTGSAEINGTLSTIRSGVGSCAAGNALTGSLSKVDGMVELPQPVVYPPPAPPATLSSTPKSVAPSGTLVLAPGTYGDLDIKGTLVLTAGTYNINSIDMGSQAEVRISSGPVILNVAGYAVAGTYEAVPSMATPITLNGGPTANFLTRDPSMFVINYAGTGTVSLLGNGGICGLIYAPNGYVTNGGTTDWYGAIIANRVSDFGTAAVHYDRRLSSKAMMVGNWMLDSFTWRKQ